MFDFRSALALTKGLSDKKVTKDLPNSDFVGNSGARIGSIDCY